MNRVLRLITATILSFIMLWNGMPSSAMAEALRAVEVLSSAPSEEVVATEEATSQGNAQPAAADVDQPDADQSDSDVEVDAAQPGANDDSPDSSAVEVEAPANDTDSVETTTSNAQSAEPNDDSAGRATSLLA